MFWISSLWIVDVGRYLLNVFKWTYYSNGLQELTCLWISIFIGTKMVWISREICIAGWIVQAENCKFIIWFLLFCETYLLFWCKNDLRNLSSLWFSLFHLMNNISLVEDWFSWLANDFSTSAGVPHLESCGRCILVI